MKCPVCKGRRICPDCGGTGRVEGARGMYEINVGALGVPKYRKCERCGGTGEL